MKMANGVIAHYEGSCSAAGHQNSWHAEYYRAECERGEVVIDNDNTVRLVMRDSHTGALTTEEVVPIHLEFEGHTHVIDAHLKWLAGGARPETALDDNIYSNAVMFGAIEASAKGRTVDVEAMVKKVVEKVSGGASQGCRTRS